MNLIRFSFVDIVSESCWFNSIAFFVLAAALYWCVVLREALQYSAVYKWGQSIRNAHWCCRKQKRGGTCNFIISSVCLQTDLRVQPPTVVSPAVWCSDAPQRMMLNIMMKWLELHITPQRSWDVLISFVKTYSSTRHKSIVTLRACLYTYWLQHTGMAGYSEVAAAVCSAQITPNA